MNYIRTLNAFYDVISAEHISANGQLLYYTLLIVGNKSGWPEWIGRTNVHLCGISGLSEKQLIKAKKELKARGLIDYTTGRRGRCSEYRILPPLERWGKNTAPQSGSNQAGNPSDLDKRNTKTKTKRNSDEFQITWDDPDVSGEAPELDAESVVDAYHEVCPALPRVDKLTRSLRRSVEAGARELGADGLRRLLDKAAASVFLAGSHGWTATLGWLLRPDNARRVLSGKYDDWNGSGGNPFIDTLIREGKI